MVKARENALHANLKNIEIMLGDGRNLCFRNGSIDIILAGTKKKKKKKKKKLKKKYIKFKNKI
jgi:hypothetical protein